MNESNRTICILPRRLGLGGPASFQSRLIAVLRERGIGITHDALDPANSAILVIGGAKQIVDLRRARRRGVRIVQRLNGMNWVHRVNFTGVRHFLKAERGNLLLSTIRSMADRIVYQSHFTQGWWDRVYGEKKTPNKIVYNGVDLNEFSPLTEEILPSKTWRILLLEGHHGGGYDQGLLTAVELVKLLNQRLEKQSELIVVGDVPQGLKDRVDALGQPVTWKGVVKPESIPEIDRSAHLLFSADVNAACPNAVIEALACGLPVIGFDTGAIPELVTGDAGRVAPYGGDPWKLVKPDIHALADAAQEVLENQPKFRAAARQRAEEAFNMQDIANQYLEALLGELK